MSKEFKGLIELLTDDEFANYIIELAKQNDFVNIVFKINSSYFVSPLELLLCSFSFNESIHGHDYWSEIVHKIRKTIK
jgi:hypothetical protein